MEDVYEWVEHDGGWTSEGSPVKDTQQEDRPGTSQVLADANNVYGYDDAYTNMTTYSNGSAMWTTVDANRYANASLYRRGFAGCSDYGLDYLFSGGGKLERR